MVSSIFHIISYVQGAIETENLYSSILLFKASFLIFVSISGCGWLGGDISVPCTSLFVCNFLEAPAHLKEKRCSLSLGLQVKGTGFYPKSSA